jgi:hypothetical protein
MTKAIEAEATGAPKRSVLLRRQEPKAASGAPEALGS